MSEVTLGALDLSSEKFVASIEQAAKSLTPLQQQLIKAAEGTEAGQKAINDLTERLAAGTIGVDQYRAGLVALVGEIPKTATELRKAATETDKLAMSSTKAAGGEGLGALTIGFNNASMAANYASQAYGRLDAAYTNVARLSAESDHLNHVQAETGLNMVDLSNHLTRFVSETELASAAMRLNEAGIRTNRDQFEQLGRAAGSLSEDLGVDTADALQKLDEWLITGSERIGRHLSPALREVSGQSHTAQERFDALAAAQHTMADATDNAATSLERQRNELERTERSFSAGFTEEARLAGGLNDQLHSVSGNLHEIHDLAPLAGTVLADLANGAVVAFRAANSQILNMVGLLGQAHTLISGGPGQAELAAGYTHPDGSGEVVTQMSDSVRAAATGQTGFEHEGQTNLRRQSANDMALRDPHTLALLRVRPEQHKQTGGAAAGAWLEGFKQHLHDHPEDTAVAIGDHLTDAAVAGIQQRFHGRAGQIVAHINHELHTEFVRQQGELRQMDRADVAREASEHLAAVQAARSGARLTDTQQQDLQSGDAVRARLQRAMAAESAEIVYYTSALQRANVPLAEQIRMRVVSPR